jgi:hypothetical protein
MLAAIRPGSWNVVLFIHVAGAMALVATLILAGFALVAAQRRGGDPAGTGFAFRVLWMGVLPSYIVMRVGAGLIASKEGLDASNVNFTWLDIGFIIADMGAVLLIVALVMAGLGARKAKRGEPAGPGALKAATALNGVLLIAYIVAIYAMTAKPA